jgi:hypothetical protein
VGSLQKQKRQSLVWEKELMEILNLYFVLKLCMWQLEMLAPILEKKVAGVTGYHIINVTLSRSRQN